MKKELLIFGANGALGRGLTQVMLKKDYDKIYLFSSKFDETTNEPSNVEKIIIRDLSQEKNVIDAFKKVYTDRNKILFLFSTIGGFAGGKTIWESEVDEWDKMFDMNLKTNYLLAKHFAKLIQQSFGGSICFTAAYTGIQEEAGKGSYGISKSALIHLVKTLALESKKINLSVNAIAPYIIDTPANRRWMKKEDYSEWIKPSEIGELVYSLFSNFHFVSGNIIKLKYRFELRERMTNY